MRCGDTSGFGFFFSWSLVLGQSRGRYRYQIILAQTKAYARKMTIKGNFIFQHHNDPNKRMASPEKRLKVRNGFRGAQTWIWLITTIKAPQSDRFEAQSKYSPGKMRLAHRFLHKKECWIKIAQSITLGGNWWFNSRSGLITKPVFLDKRLTPCSAVKLSKQQIP